MHEPVVLMLYRQLQFLDFISPHVMESGIREVFACGIRDPGIFLVLESAILDFGFQNAVQGIRNPTNDWNPESRFQ